MTQRTTIRSESDSASRTDAATSDAEPLIRVENLTKRYGDLVAVDGISFDIEPGSIVGVLGPNGAGKTTTIKSMLGMLVPDEGTVEIDGNSVRENPEWVHQNVGTMFEGSRDAYWRLTVRENLDFFTRLNGVPASQRRDQHDELLERLGLTGKADEPVRKLSRGMKQKVALASTLSQDIQLLFLDEPTLGLDVETSMTLIDELRALVENENLTVILTSHNMDVIETLCDRVIILSEGEIIADDYIDNLLRFFQENAYQVRLDAPVSDAARSSLASHPDLDVTGSEVYADIHEFTITLRDGDVHTLSNALEALDCTVQSIETAAPDLEGIFLEITREEADDDE